MIKASLRATSHSSTGTPGPLSSVRLNTAGAAFFPLLRLLGEEGLGDESMLTMMSELKGYYELPILSSVPPSLMYRGPRGLIWRCNRWGRSYWQQFPGVPDGVMLESGTVEALGNLTVVMFKVNKEGLRVKLMNMESSKMLIT